MARRKPYTKVHKENQIRPAHVKRMGDVVFKGFQCLRPDCREFIFVQKDDISEFFEISCPTCANVHKYGDEAKFYDYKLRDLREDSILKEGEFTILHDDYLEEAEEFKYCIICCTLKPVTMFDQHSARKSKRQGECRLCKSVYNTLKNPTRTTDQHRESAQKRRLYMDFAGGEKIDSKNVYERFRYKCFKCGKDLRQDIQAESARRGGNLDHTLPVRFLWPLTTRNATLLCARHNLEKTDKWPSEFYDDRKLKSLVTLTGIPYDTMAGLSFYNPEAIRRLSDAEFVNALLEKHAAYMNEMILIRNRILIATGLDFFAVSGTLSNEWIEKADERLGS